MAPLIVIGFGGYLAAAASLCWLTGPVRGLQPARVLARPGQTRR